MANSDVVNLIIAGSANMIHYLLPVIGVLAGLTFMFTFLMSVTMGFGRRTFGK